MKGTRSIRGSLTTSLIVGAGILTLVVALLLDFLITGFLTERFDTDMSNRAQALITLTKQYEGGIELDFAGEFMPEFEEPEGPEYFELWLPDGSLLERSESLEDRALPAPHTFTPVPLWREVQLAEGGRCRLLTLSFHPQQEDADIEGQLNPGGDPEQAATLLLARNRSDFDRLLLTIHLLIWGLLGGLLLVTVVLVRLALRNGLAPLEQIGRQVGAIDLNAIDNRIHLKEPVAELAPVVGQLNAMLARLEAAVVRERRFSSDVAHELRTPLAELRSLTEVGARDPDDRDMVLGFFADAHEIALEMQNLVTNLLELTRNEAAATPTLSEPVDLAEIVDKAWKRAAAVAQRRDIGIDNRLETSFLVTTDPRMLEQIVQNLINNAVTHGPQHSRVTVLAQLSAQRPFLTIANPAANLSQQDLEPMFERFWQKDSARTGGKNTGLGLPLAAALAKRLGIRIEARLEDGQLTVLLYFPLN